MTDLLLWLLCGLTWNFLVEKSIKKYFSATFFSFEYNLEWSGCFQIWSYNCFSSLILTKGFVGLFSRWHRWQKWCSCKILRGWDGAAPFWRSRGSGRRPRRPPTGETAEKETRPVVETILSPLQCFLLPVSITTRPNRPSLFNEWTLCILIGRLRMENLYDRFNPHLKLRCTVSAYDLCKLPEQVYQDCRQGWQLCHTPIKA